MNPLVRFRPGALRGGRVGEIPENLELAFDAMVHEKQEGFSFGLTPVLALEAALAF